MWDAYLSLPPRFMVLCYAAITTWIYGRNFTYVARASCFCRAWRNVFKYVQEPALALVKGRYCTLKDGDEIQRERERERKCDFMIRGCSSHSFRLEEHLLLPSSLESIS